MSDEPYWSPTHKPPAARVAKGELLFEFRKNSDHYVCELRDHGEFGIEAPFLLNGDLYIARAFQDQPDLQLEGRRLTIAWAEQERNYKIRYPAGASTRTGAFHGGISFGPTCFRRASASAWLRPSVRDANSCNRVEASTRAVASN
jgi:hypothetical protein